MLTNKYSRVPLEKIKVNRDERQRKQIDVTDLLSSIQTRGVIQPIILTDDFWLVAGERRLEASRQLGLPDIPSRFARDLSETEAKIIELEENVKRLDLPWTDRALALLGIHELYSSMDSNWSQVKTAEAVGLSSTSITHHIKVAKELRLGNQRIVLAGGFQRAVNIIARDESRRSGDALSELIEAITPADIAGTGGDGGDGEEDFGGELARTGAEGEGPPEHKDGPISNPAVALRVYKPAPLSEAILLADFREFAQHYSGKTFNFIHCDFPYGIGLDSSDQAGSESWASTYEDSEEIYWELLETLATYQNRFISMSAHMMFWFSMDYYTETLEFFARRMPDWEFQTFPLYWTKTDNRGILPDPKRGPRRIVETCFIGSRGDRQIVKAVSNWYGCPSGGKTHQSEKAQPMLHHFFQMFVDQGSHVLDPTCGSGAALRAAETLKAASIVGLEINPDFVESARQELKKFRALRSLSAGLGTQEILP